MIIENITFEKHEITALLLLLLLHLFSFSCSSSKMDQNYCDRLAEIKTIPLKGEPVDDEVYNGLLAMGKTAIPCLIDELTDNRNMYIEKTAPYYGEVTVGAVAFFVLIDITGDAPLADVFPPKLMEQWKTHGVYAYFKFIGNEANRKIIQDRWRIWYGKHKAS